MSPTLSWIVLAADARQHDGGVLTATSAGRNKADGLAAPPIGVTLLTIVLPGSAASHSSPSATRRHRRACPGSCPSSSSCSACSVRAEPDQARPLHLRDRRQSGGRPPRRRQCFADKNHRLRDLRSARRFAGMTYASRLGSMSTDIDGGTYVLYAVAAAVIGGASLFGGRGRPLNALLGGLVIAVVERAWPDGSQRRWHRTSSRRRADRRC